MKSLQGGEYHYKESDRLGGGSFGQVYKGIKVSTGEVIAVKVIPLTLVEKYGDKILKAINNEIKTMQSFLKDRNPYIVEIFDNFETSNNIYILTEYCDSGDLQGI
jgi:serine/threonine protein kinase